MEMSLAGRVPRWRVKKAFDGIGRAVEGRTAKVDRAINNPITTIAQDAHEFEGAIVDDGTDSGRTRKIVRRHTVGKGLQDLQEVCLGEEGGCGCLTAKEGVVEEVGGEAGEAVRHRHNMSQPRLPGTEVACQ